MSNEQPGAHAEPVYYFATLKEIAETLNRSASFQQAVDHTLPLVVRLLELHTAWLFLLDEKQHFKLAAHHNLPPALAFPGPPWCGKCTCQDYAVDGTLGSAQVVQCSRLRDAIGDRQELSYHASVPLLANDTLLGIMNVATSSWDTFREQDLHILSAVGLQLAAAIVRIRLAEQATLVALVEERNRLAREVHDTLAQELSGITLQLEAADALLDTAPERARSRLQQALLRTRESLAEARRSVLDLRTGPLERLDLPRALAELAARIREESNLAVDVNVEIGERRLPSRYEQALYRIVQEALANVRRHARANSATVELTADEDALRLRISDDGVGFDEASTTKSPEHFGLISMQERAHLLGGSMWVCSEPGKGTTIEVRVPVEM